MSEEQGVHHPVRAIHTKGQPPRRFTDTRPEKKYLRGHALHGHSVWRRRICDRHRACGKYRRGSAMGGGVLSDKQITGFAEPALWRKAVPALWRKAVPAPLVLA